MAATKPVLCRIPFDLKQVLEALAEYRSVATEDLASDILAAWLSGHGRRELIRRLASPPPAAGHPTRRRRELAGQMSVDDALRGVV